jgi:SAM-dependent methyltransferase
MTGCVQPAAACCSELYELPIVEYLLGQSFHPGGPKLTRQLASTVLVANDSEVLDVACGMGNSARIVAADCGASITGCDISVANTERATLASHNAGLAPQTTFVCGHAERLPFKDRSFDVALCECSLCLFESVDIALAEIFRVLKPGGRIGVSDFYLNTSVPPALDGLLGKALCVASAASEKSLQQAFMSAGFEYVRVRRVNWALEEMITRVRRNLSTLAVAGPSDLTLPGTWGDPRETLSALEKFIAENGTGYLIISGRKPE